MATLGGYIDGRETGQHDMLNWIEDGGFMLVEDAVQWRAWAWCLAHNLAIAGGLCRAFYDGLDEAEDHRLYHQHGYRTGGCWMPGCLLDAIRAALEGTT